MNAFRAIRPRGATPAQVGYYLARLSLLPLVRWRRRRLEQTTVIGITGSAGKSTAVRLLAAVLEGQGDVYASPRTSNTARSLVRMARRIGGSPRFLVHELAAWAPGTMRELAWTLEPDVAVVTVVGWDHYRAFRGPDGAAAEKAELVRALPAGGLAVLNADDERVRAMAAQTRARVVFFGEEEGVDYRATSVAAVWPDRLGFDLVHPTGRVSVSTRLVGRHWAPSVVAALATAIELGVPAETAASRVSETAPVALRFEEVDGGGGVTFLLDDFKAPVWTVWPALDVLGEARAARRIAVIGQLSDDPRRPRDLYRQVVEYARERAEVVVVTGRWAETAVRRFTGDAAVHGFASMRDAQRFLASELRPGDLVLLKGTVSSDHSERLLLARTGTVRCWRDACGRVTPCQRCPELGRPHEP